MKWYRVAWGYVASRFDVSTEQAIREWNASIAPLLFPASRSNEPIGDTPALQSKLETLESLPASVWKAKNAERRLHIARLRSAINESQAYLFKVSFEDHWIKASPLMSRGLDGYSTHGLIHCPPASDDDVPLALLGKLSAMRTTYPQLVRKLSELAGIEKLIFPRKRKPQLENERKATVKTVLNDPPKKVMCWRRLKSEKNHLEVVPFWLTPKTYVLELPSFWRPKRKRIGKDGTLISLPGQFVKQEIMTNILIRERKRTFTRDESRFYSHVDDDKRGLEFQETVWRSAKEIIASDWVFRYEYKWVHVPICEPELPTLPVKPELTDQEYLSCSSVVSFPESVNIVRAEYGRPRTDQPIVTQFDAYDASLRREALSKATEASKQARAERKAMQANVERLTRHVNRNLHKA